MKRFIIGILWFSLIAWNCKESVGPEKIAAIEVSDNLLYSGIKGAGMSLMLPRTNEIYWVEVGDASETGGIEGFTAGYTKDAGAAHHGINISSTFIRAIANNDGGPIVGWIIQDPEGMIVIGKNSAPEQYGFRVFDGIAGGGQSKVCSKK